LSEEIQDRQGLIDRTQAPLAGGQCPLFPPTLLQQVEESEQGRLFAAAEKTPLALVANISR